MNKREKISVLGFGSQGRAIALNLRDSGYNIVVGLRRGSKSAKAVKKEKLPAIEIERAAKEGEVIIVALPDQVHQEVFNNRLLSVMNQDTRLVFLHGASIHFGLVKPPDKISVLLLAPHAPGLAVRSNYLDGKKYSAFYGVHQGAKAEGYKVLKKLAAGIGIPASHLIRTTFADEAIGDIFGEQAVLCGGLARLLKFGFETLVEAGLPPHNAYLEVAFQIDLIVDLVKKYGLAGMLDRISPLAKYGSVVNGPAVIDNKVKANMKKILKEIESGKFIEKAVRVQMKPKKSDINLLTNLSFDRQAKKYSGKMDD